MYPGPLTIFGTQWATWNILFLVGSAVAFFVLRHTYKVLGEPKAPGFLLLRYLLCVYVCALGAQWFSYAFDANTSVLPPEGFNAWRYYLHPLAGPKTLYGAILALPLSSLAFVSAPKLTWPVALDRSVPALFTILGFARIGCFLQGCCYGFRTDEFGLVFAVGSLVHADQFQARLISIDQHALPVLPTQIASSVACFLLAAWSFGALRRRTPDVFIRSTAAYSFFRFAIEFVRADDARNHLWALSTSQWVAVAILAAVAIRWIRSSGTKTC